MTGTSTCLPNSGAIPRLVPVFLSIRLVMSSLSKTLKRHSGRHSTNRKPRYLVTFDVSDRHHLNGLQLRLRAQASASEKAFRPVLYCLVRKLDPNSVPIRGWNPHGLRAAARVFLRPHSTRLEHRLNLRELAYLNAGGYHISHIRRNKKDVPFRKRRRSEWSGLEGKVNMPSSS
jgi:hypothetical protein